MRPCLKPLLDHTESEAWVSGESSHIHDCLGAHTVDGGVRFAVWAPNAAAVSVVGDFNDWEAGRMPMQKDAQSGIWQAFSEEAAPGDRYKYAVTPAGDGSQASTSSAGSSGSRTGPGSAADLLLKSDPVAFRTEAPPGTASVVAGDRSYEWGDAEWMRQREERQSPGRPLAIYEVHLGSWRPPSGGGEPGYESVAEELARYAVEMGFTHIELMPLAEHPYGASWGYQVTGFFAPTARYGEPRGLKTLVDCCHRHGLGVIMDWVPAHFPKDEHGLCRFDGTPLYEHPDPRRSEHADWGTANFDFEKGEVRSFLLSNASWWCSEYHVDGLRVDAVASMLYLDYSKTGGEWLPNVYGGRENLGAVAFLQDLHGMLRENHPGVITAAEESTTWPGVTRSTAEGGLGFDYKWNMGWMNDTLHYFSLPPEERLPEHHGITFSATYLFDERFILPFSHDEVVHLKGSLWEKMPGDDRQKFRNLRLLYLFWIGFPGKKLLFMGGEWGQRGEWSEAGALSWDEPATLPAHRQLREYLVRLLALYREEPVLHHEPEGWDGFAWGDLEGRGKGVFSFTRTDPQGGQGLRFLFNFGPLEQQVPVARSSRLRFHSLEEGEDPGRREEPAPGEDPGGGQAGPESAGSGESREERPFRLAPCSGAVLSV